MSKVPGSYPLSSHGPFLSFKRVQWFGFCFPPPPPQELLILGQTVRSCWVFTPLQLWEMFVPFCRSFKQLQSARTTSPVSCFSPNTEAHFIIWPLTRTVKQHGWPWKALRDLLVKNRKLFYLFWPLMLIITNKSSLKQLFDNRDQTTLRRVSKMCLLSIQRLEIQKLYER